MQHVLPCGSIVHCNMEALTRPPRTARSQSSRPGACRPDSLALPPSRDRPNRFDKVLAQAVDAVVEVHRRVTMGDDELEPIAQLDGRRRTPHVQLAMFVSAPRIH